MLIDVLKLGSFRKLNYQNDYKLFKNNWIIGQKAITEFRLAKLPGISANYTKKLVPSSSGSVSAKMKSETTISSFIICLAITSYSIATSGVSYNVNQPL